LFELIANDHGLLPAVELKSFQPSRTTNIFLINGEANTQQAFRQATCWAQNFF